MSSPEHPSCSHKSDSEASAISRRELLVRGAAAGLAIAPGIAILSGCSNPAPPMPEKSAAGAGNVFVLQAGSAEMSPDGRRREVRCYDASIPGPTIRAKLGEKIRVRVTNKLDVPTSVHWHGMHQPGTWQMDGVTGVSHVPIQPEESFVYEFTATPAGTHWYHSHTGVQYGDGLFGPLIVEENVPLARYDREEILFINDWFLKPADEILAGLLKSGPAMPGMKKDDGAPASEGVAPTAEKMKMPAGKMADKADGEKMPAMPRDGAATDKMPTGMKMPADIGDVPFESALINGFGRFGEDAAGPLATIEVQPNETLRLRLINGSSTYAFRFQVDGHPLTVITSDGAPLVPVDVDNLVINVGERYDVLIHATGEGAVWIRAATLAGDEARAVLRYPKSPPEPEPTSVIWGERLLQPEQMRSPQALAMSVKSPREIALKLGGSMSPYVWSIDGEVFPKAAPIELAANETVRFAIENPTDMDHPFHLHGHYFRVLGNPEALNLADPPQKDTVNIPARSTLVLQWQANNPGKWFFHCHIQWHVETGMARVIEIA